MQDKNVNDIVRKYVGIPFRDHGEDFDGCDCYGLVCLLYRTEFGLTLPHVGDLYDNAYDRKKIHALLGKNSNAPWCVDVTRSEWKPFDVLVFRIAGTEYHIGMWIKPGHMLHILENSNAGIERFDGARWKMQLHRVLRHGEMPCAK